MEKAGHWCQNFILVEGEPFVAREPAGNSLFDPKRYRTKYDVIPNLPDEGGQERDLTSACANDAVWLRRVRA